MNIKEARLQKGMSRVELSKWLDIPYKTITGWEQGLRSCPPYVERLIVEKILEGQETPEEEKERLLKRIAEIDKILGE